MSVANPPTPAPPTATQPVAASVIRRIGGVEESASDRLVNRHLPAWVASGLVHLLIILFAYGITLYYFQSDPTVAKEKLLTTTVEKEPEEAIKDLTNEDPGFDSSIPSALPDQEKEADKTSEGIINDDPVGNPTTTQNDSVNLTPPGLPTSEAGASGVQGDIGAFMKGDNGAMGSISAAFNGRGGATKSKLLREGGGNAESELAVARGLAWLARQQKANGSWEFDPKDQKLRGRDFTTSTGLALLPFLAAGQTHKANCRYQKNVADAIGYLVSSLNKSTGMFNYGSGQHYMYGHGIATMALCEAYGMTKDRNLKEPAQAAINYIIQAQYQDGSWGYLSGTAGDTSIVGWQVQALRAAELSKDLVVPEKTVKLAMKFLDKVSSGSLKSKYGYRTSAEAAPGTSRTAVGLLCRYYMDKWGPGNAGMAEGVIGLFGTSKPGAKPDEPQTDRSRAPFTKEQVKNNGSMPEMYYYYYATQVVHFFEGPEWREWNEGPKDANGQRLGGMRDWLIAMQNKSDKNLGGSWEPDGGSIGKNCGRVGETALCLLTLEVYYRHLPLYKRDQGGAAIIDAVR